LPVEASFLREYRRNWPVLSLRIIPGLDAVLRRNVAFCQMISAGLIGACRRVLGLRWSVLLAAFMCDLQGLFSGDDIGLNR
jgi:hypothetical protein